RLPVDDIDVLIVDEMGKEISGSGMDSNVIGRLRIAGQPEPAAPRIKQIVVLRLTEATHGNACGVGFADFTTRQLLEQIDFKTTVTNIFTSGFLERGYLPLVLETGAEAVDMALRTAFRPSPERIPDARIIR